MTTDHDLAVLLDSLRASNEPLAPQLLSSVNTLILTIAAQASIIRSLEVELRARRAGDEPLGAIISRFPRAASASPSRSGISTDDALAACRELADAAASSRDVTTILVQVARVARALLL